MNYIFKGRLCGYICHECLEPLFNVKVRIYRANQEQNVVARAVANPKDTLAVLSDEEVRAKESQLIAETETDADGNFTISLGDKQGYEGEAFEVDVYCGTVPRRPVGPNPPPRQFSITTLQPLWRRSENGLRAFWDYCLPYRFWCLFRALFGAWTICGKVTTCDQTKTPVGAVKVTAFDADWWQDDELGSATTDSNGKFRIDYLADDFRKTPFSPLINVEWYGGPDLYFKIESSGGNVLLEEPSSRGRAPDRENAGSCFCVDLCVDIDQPPPYPNPLFTHVGDFHIYTNINAATGMTNSAVLGHGGPNYGFFGYLKLRGFCPKTSPIGAPDPMRYRFLYEHPDNPGVIVPITPDKIYPVLVGSRLIQWDLFGTGPIWTFQSIVVAGSGATPDPTPTPVLPPGTPWGPVPDHVIVPDAGGWVPVDQNGLDDGFYGPLIRFKSDTAVPGGAAPGNGPGVSPLTDPKNGVSLKIYFEAGPVGGGAATFANQLSNIKINNWSEVRELNLAQFEGPGATSCSDLNTDLDIKYTADHELMADWGVSINSASPSAPGAVIPPFPVGSTTRGGIGTKHIDISTWQSCSYQVWLSTRRALTDGENDDSGGSSLVTFCK